MLFGHPESRLAGFSCFPSSRSAWRSRAAAAYLRALRRGAVFICDGVS
jgi:hypothetical protein